VGPRAGLDGCGKSRPPPGFDPWTVQPVASRHTHYAIPVPILRHVNTKISKTSIFWFTEDQVFNSRLTISQEQNPKVGGLQKFSLFGNSVFLCFLTFTTNARRYTMIHVLECDLVCKSYLSFLRQGIPVVFPVKHSTVTDRTLISSVRHTLAAHKLLT
jgi:hypothetical protein